MTHARAQDAGGVLGGIQAGFRRGGARAGLHGRSGLLIGGVVVGILLGGPQGAGCQEAADGRPGPAPPEKPAYLRRGDEVEARYRAYRERLERLFDKLAAQVRDEAPDLHARLTAARPAPVPYGYQILPKVLPDPPAAGRPSRAVSSSYSWRRTQGFVDRDLARLDRLESALVGASTMASEARRVAWERIVDGCLSLAANQKLIDNHIQYNRLWQREIHRRRDAYDLGTWLHDAVIERQAFLDALDAGDPLMEPSLREREQELFRLVQERSGRRFMPRDFVRVDQPDPRLWIVRVPLYSDIEDRAFLEEFQKSVERAWRVRSEAGEFRVSIEMRSISAKQLYADRAACRDPGQGVCALPTRGEHIDLGRHLGLFPPGAGVLTTGANTTHLYGRSIILGPHDITPNVLAHEFGHVLGFPDLYFRGYRDRGTEGYEVLEVMTNPEDIMSAPGVGRVWPYHFEAILLGRRKSGSGRSTGGRVGAPSSQSAPAPPR